ncbi:MAG TPA: hypothetical protein VK158_03865 [Acidobacteriota bacterium]|nr:hypothetical protein [Acidobacteriota bacterium]
MSFSAFAAGNSGSVWTSNVDCSVLSQDVNQYAIAELVHINGANFDPNTQYSWKIEGTPGSADSNVIVAQGTITTDVNGSLCFPAYYVQPNDGGTYKFGVGTKNDNYRVIGTTISKTAVAHLSREYSWTVDKKANQSSLSMFNGDSKNVNYTINATRTVVPGTDVYFVNGTIDLTNTNTGTGTGLLDLTDCLQYQKSGIWYDLECQLINSAFTLPGAGAQKYVYSIVYDPSDIPSGVTAYRNDARITIHANPTSGVLNATASFTPRVTPDASVDGTATLEDSNGMSWNLNGSSVKSYVQALSCAADIGTNTNTAVLTPTDSQNEIQDSVDVEVSCYELSVTKTANTAYTTKYNWDVVKTATPTDIELITGQSQEVEYTVTVSSTPVDSNWNVSGTITVSNPNPIAATINSVSDSMTGGVNAVVTCGVSFPYTIPANGNLICSYKANLSNGNNRENTAVAVLKNTPSGTTNVIGTVDVDFSEATVTEVDASADIEDSLEGFLGTLDQSETPQEYTYTKEFSCENVGTTPNTATATALDTETVSSDDEDVTVTCSDLIVTKTADTSFTRTYGWELTKTVDDESVVLFEGQEQTVEYTVTATSTPVDTDWTVSGTITVANPSTASAMIASVEDIVSPDVVAIVDCGEVSFPYELVGGDELVCTYTSALEDDSDRTNTATVTTVEDVTFSGSADVSFENAIINEVDAEVPVEDSMGGELGEAVQGEESTVFTYEHTFVCGEDNGLHENIAQLTTSDDVIEAQQDVQVDCYAVEVSKDVETSFTRTHDWTISKDVDTNIVDLMNGQQQTVNYVVTATSESTDSEWKAVGTITVSNPAPIAVTIQSVTDVVSEEIPADVNCNVEFPYVLAAESAIECSYSVDLQNADARENTATVTTLESEYTGTADVIFTEEGMTEIDPILPVMDSVEGNLGNAEHDQENVFEYSATFTCDEDAGEHPNVASMTTSFGEISDSESVLVNCYGLEVSKDVETSFTRTYDWTITKAVSDNQVDLLEGESQTVDYDVTVSSEYTDSNWKAVGTISVYNPAPIAAEVSSVSDVVSNDIVADVDCGEEFPIVIPAGETLVCDYEVSLPDATDRINTATAETANDVEGTTSYSGMADVSFESAIMTEVDEMATVDDSVQGILGDVAQSETPKVFEYSTKFTCGADKGSYPNVATLTTADTETEMSDDQTVDVNCYALEVSKDVETSFTRTYDWTISKDVDTNLVDLMNGQQQTVNYVVTATSETVDSNWKAVGTITVSNPSPVDATITSVTDVMSGDVQADVVCAEEFPIVLGAGESIECSYSADLPNANDRENTATVTTAQAEYSGFADVDFGAATITEIDAELPVMDSVEGELGIATQGEENVFEYSATFTCDEDAGEHPNVASMTTASGVISDDETVQVNCYSLDVSKTAETSFTRTYTWDITKTANVTGPVTIDMGQPYNIGYTVSLTKTGFTDSDWAVEGTITIHNPAPVDATINSVDDVIAGPVSADVDCGVTFPYTLEAGQDLVCDYTASLPNADTRVNTATVETPGSISYSGQAEVSFNEADMLEIDEAVTVSDSLPGTTGNTPAGTVSVLEGPKVFKYSYNAQQNVCAPFVVDNTASFVTVDTGATASDSVSLPINVVCGCTLTQGYWKTHSLAGKAPYDDNWKNVGPLEHNTKFYLSGQTWLQVFNTPVAGNAYYQLAHQYMAAKLNVMNGASAPASVTNAITQAEALFAAKTPAQVKAMKGSQTAQWVTLAGILGSFNEGAIGPGHCSE